MPKSEFRIELESLINRHSLENGSDTPDFILAKFMIGALDNFEAAINEREEWYGRQKHLSDIPEANNIPEEGSGKPPPDSNFDGGTGDAIIILPNGLQPSTTDNYKIEG